MTDRTLKQTRWLVLAVVVAACLPYVFTIADYFVQDDFGVIKVITARPWTTFPRWFVMPWTENTWGYTPDELRPFVAFTYQLTGKWNPARPELHHVFNIAMHAANAVLVMSIARAALQLSPLASAFAGLVFAVLPAQVESVAWVTGRVDSMPTCFYLATFLAYVRWRAHRRPGAYVWALVWFFIALFSKQNTITMVATLAAYDVVMLTREQRGSLVSTVLGWVPFGILTLAFLTLRRLLFGASLRAAPRNIYEIVAILERLGHHVHRTLTGTLQPPSRVDLLMAVLLAVGAAVVLLRSQPAARVRFVRGAACLGVLWMAIGLAPSVLAGYESPRHAYLASAGWAFLLALLLDGVRANARRAAASWMTAAVAVVIVTLYATRLAPIVRAWHTLARISEAATDRAQHEAASSPPGTLLIVGLPLKSWEYSSPFMIQPPFAQVDFVDRIHLITTWRLYCCGTELWEAYTRQHLRAWADASPRAPVIALRFAPDTGALSRITDAEFPELRQIVPELLRTRTSDELDTVISDILERMVAGHPVDTSSPRPPVR